MTQLEFAEMVTRPSDSSSYRIAQDSIPFLSAGNNSRLDNGKFIEENGALVFRPREGLALNRIFPANFIEILQHRQALHDDPEHFDE
jgi:hypothetical protein